MKKCLTCSNMIPDGRVISKCDGCLALYYYGHALDRIVEVIDNGEPDKRISVVERVRAIAVNAIQSVPRHKEKQDG